MAGNTAIFSIIGTVLLCAWLAGIGFGIFFMVRHFIRVMKNGDSTARTWHILTLVSVLFMAASWVLNFGWYRVFLTWIPLPLGHIVAFMLINFKVASKASAHKPLNKLIGMSCLTFLLTYLSFPDGGDVGGAYMFFSLIKNEVVIYISTYVVLIALILNIVILALEIKEFSKPKKETQNEV